MFTIYQTEGYKSALSVRDTQKAIAAVRQYFQKKLCEKLNLERVSAPMLVVANTGVNDDLNGVERPVSFDIKDVSDFKVEVVHSLAKWKRMALADYGYNVGEGFFTDMNAIRRDEDLDNFHSIYVDQWDWEKVISREQRTKEFLFDTVKDIVKSVCQTSKYIKKRYPALKTNLCQEVFFIDSQELENMYPGLTPTERENEITKQKKTVFIWKIGDKLKSGEPHGGRAPDYDDWSLNGDILFWHEPTNKALEVSSMGIRVDKDSLVSQLFKKGLEERLGYRYHQGIVNETLPLTIGGGIGQSRLCMLLLDKVHIGEVQSSIWPEEMRKLCKEKNIHLL